MENRNIEVLSRAQFKLSCSNPYNQGDNVKYGNLNIKFSKIGKEKAKRYYSDVFWEMGLQTVEDTTD